MRRAGVRRWAEARCPASDPGVGSTGNSRRGHPDAQAASWRIVLRLPAKENTVPQLCSLRTNVRSLRGLSAVFPRSLCVLSAWMSLVRQLYSPSGGGRFGWGSAGGKTVLQEGACRGGAPCWQLCQRLVRLLAGGSMLCHPPACDPAGIRGAWPLGNVRARGPRLQAVRARSMCRWRLDPGTGRRVELLVGVDPPHRHPVGARQAGERRVQRPDLGRGGLLLVEVAEHADPHVVLVVLGHVGALPAEVAAGEGASGRIGSRSGSRCRPSPAGGGPRG